MTHAAVLSDSDLPADPFLDDDATEPVSGFAALGLDERLVGTVVADGFHSPTPIQSETFPLLLAGRDVLGLARTTAALAELLA